MQYTGILKNYLRIENKYWEEIELSVAHNLAKGLKIAIVAERIESRYEEMYYLQWIYVKNGKIKVNMWIKVVSLQDNMDFYILNKNEACPKK